MESGVIFDKFYKCSFPRRADGVKVCDIDDEFTAVEMLPGFRVLAKEFGDPRLNERTLDRQSATARAPDERDFQHSMRFREGPGAQSACQSLKSVTI